MNDSLTNVLRAAVVKAVAVRGVRGLAADAGVEPAAVSLFVRGKSDLRLRTADALAAALALELRPKPRKAKR